ncbi:M24 family metallopeptidase [Acidisoma cladoniae]|jgi:Xaa-Pro aminopeptidase|uniref:M24 family metallopeptidase n=1 Tax=Acidisoma cladoniae TaxID=3040935 RepID=UPI00254B21B1|nr:Xaa-Pro peptidase family protein [Acidisoma sp. PAMC 29798]
MKSSANDLINLDRLAAQMDAAGVDAIVARAGLNFTYLAGFAYPGTLARHVDLADSPRAVYLVWPRQGEPRIIANTIAAPLAQRDSWVAHFDLYEGYTEKPAEALAQTLKTMGLADATVAFECDYVSMADGAILRARLPQMRMVDSTDLMERVRAIKTPGEIARLKHGARILDNAFLAHFATVRPGMRERDLHAAIVGECIIGGSEFTHGILNSSRNTMPYGGESDFVFEAGDAIRTDYVAYFNGYPGHQSRCAVVGEPTAEQTREYRVIRDIYRSVNEQLVPGVTAGAIYQCVKDRFAEVGMPYNSILAGHSVGCWWHQQEPMISRDNARVLEEGMVIAMEPFVNHWHIQDMLLIGRDGPELLSPDFNTDDIFACV